MQEEIYIASERDSERSGREEECEREREIEREGAIDV